MPAGLMVSEVIRHFLARRHNPAMPRILLIDDDEHLAAPLTTYFARFGCTLESAVRPSEGLAKLRAGHLRRGDPRRDAARDGRLRAVPRDPQGKRHSHRDAHRSRRGDGPRGRPGARRRRLRAQALRAARAGGARADHPAAPAQRAAGAGRQASSCVFDGLAIDLDRRQVLRHGERVELTGTEFELLALLAGEPGKVFSRDDILNRLRGHEAELYTRAVDIVVSRLRKKLEPLDCIKTLRNAGYALAVARSEAA
jgi:two-component system OmpR family response regulator